MSRVKKLEMKDGKYDLDALKNHFMQGGIIEQKSIEELVEKSINIFKEEPNMITVKEASLIFGDFHGQYFDFLFQYYDKEWNNTPHKTIMLGDYVDRGDNSCELLITLLCMKCNDPTNLIMLRGNHEVCL